MEQRMLMTEIVLTYVPFVAIKAGTIIDVISINHPAKTAFVKYKDSNGFEHEERHFSLEDLQEYTCRVDNSDKLDSITKEYIDKELSDFSFTMSKDVLDTIDDNDKSFIRRHFFKLSILIIGFIFLYNIVSIILDPLVEALMKAMGL